MANTLATRPRLSHRQWHDIEDVLAQMCERTHGQLEDLHGGGCARRESR
ncbi:hypothetical protein SacmaDRAFT_1988 [Saccharomonospora marina XMU15]|uniref:Uncharacterized protein n=1 Tax=Saccharomonospora marina XMU15 TaxID=882083 RepID=H5X8E9_9PSEU|nr:hypothetical protein [Saccharomonospora marina]EHR50245.1 hypothetical protein SacmaDRAFT_1988 [Saccharomonospora marina XMU15]